MSTLKSLGVALAVLALAAALATGFYLKQPSFLFPQPFSLSVAPPAPSSVADEMTIINKFRQDNHLSVLTENSVLSKSARLFAKYLSRAKKLGQKDSAGRDEWDQAMAQGYKPVRTGQIIASGYPTFAAAFDAIQTKQRDVTILKDAAFTEFGLGIVADPSANYKYVYVIVLGAPKH